MSLRNKLDKAEWAINLENTVVSGQQILNIEPEVFRFCAL